MIKFIQVTVEPELCHYRPADRLLRCKVMIETETKRTEAVKMFPFPMFNSVFRIVMEDVTREIEAHMKQP